MHPVKYVVGGKKVCAHCEILWLMVSKFMLTVKYCGWGNKGMLPVKYCGWG